MGVGALVCACVEGIRGCDGMGTRKGGGGHMALGYCSSTQLPHPAPRSSNSCSFLPLLACSVFNTFLGSVMGGAIFQQLGSLLDTPGGRWAYVYFIWSF